MKWILITGTWKLANQEVEKDVRRAVQDIIARGDGVITGGATGVDFYAMDEGLKADQTAAQLKIIIPAQLEDYIKDVYNNWCVLPITQDVIDALANLLRKIKKIHPESIIEMGYQTITQEHYDLRNIEEVKIADEVYAFQVNDSTGTQHTIDQAKFAGIPVTLHKKYKI